ncbi:MAG TPA: hypothetical protein VG328_23585 [Stellaceae bacterium]|jgi:Flp pilus assembly pilin Flp|nr:hypothetical protein [Stellaceae bacterium]
MGKIIKRLFAGRTAATAIEAGLVVILVGAVILTAANVLRNDEGVNKTSLDRSAPTTSGG